MCVCVLGHISQGYFFCVQILFQQRNYCSILNLEIFSLDILLRLMFPLFILRKFVKCSVFKTKQLLKEKCLFVKWMHIFLYFQKKMDKYKKVIRRCDLQASGPSRDKRRSQNWAPFFIQDKEDEVYEYRLKNLLNFNLKSPFYPKKQILRGAKVKYPGLKLSSYLLTSNPLQDLWAEDDQNPTYLLKNCSK